PAAAVLGTAPGAASWDDDDWDAKVSDLTAHPVPIVSFTFGCPEPDVIAALRAAGSSVWVTITSAAEAEIAASAGADCLCVQGAGTPGDPAGVADLMAAVREVSALPLVAAGGIMDAAGTAAALAAGPSPGQCGTAFLRSPECGANPAHKAALADPRYTDTAITRAFSGRPARGLVNDFMRRHQDAPAAYPEINNATRPMRAAAAAIGDTDRMSLWAGRGFRAATSGPAGEIVDMLCGPGP